MRFHTKNRLKNSCLILIEALLISLFSINSSAQSYNNDGDSLFASSAIHTVYFNFYHTSFYDSLTASKISDEYYTCNMIVDGIQYDSVGVKFKGNSSYGIANQKKSMKVDLDINIDGQDIDDLNKFNLNNLYHDPTGVREKILSDFAVKNSIPAPRVAYAKVYYNNAYWGLYTLVEEVNKDFIDGWFNDQVGNLFKGDPSGDLRWINSSPSSYYPKYELKTNETANDWSDLVGFIDKINNTPISGLRDTLDNNLDVTGFLKSWAICNIFVSLDSYIGSKHNYYIYHDSTDNRFKWIMWDLNSWFGVFNQNMTVAQMENLSLNYLSAPASSHPLCFRILEDVATKNELYSWFCTFLENDQFSNEHLDPIIDSLTNRIRADIFADPNFTYSDQQFEDNRTLTVLADNKSYPGLKTFISNRRTALFNALSSFGCSAGLNQEEKETFLVYPNPSCKEITIQIENPFEKTTISLSDLSGRVVLTKTSENANSVILDVSTLNSGTYILTLNKNNFVKLQVDH